MCKIFKKLVGQIKKCFSKDSYADASVYEFNLSLLVASLVFFCTGAVLFFF